VIHPAVAHIIWSDHKKSSFLSPFRFCDHSRGHDDLDCDSFSSKVYFLDFAGGGAVHLLGNDV